MITAHQFPDRRGKSRGSIFWPYEVYRWGLIGSEIGWHGGKAAVRRPRVRQRGGGEVQLSNWTAIQKADLLSRWAFNQMLIGVATRKYARSVRLPDGDLAGQAKRATTKSSVSRRFVALSTAKLKEHGIAETSFLCDVSGMAPLGHIPRLNVLVYDQYVAIMRVR